MPGDIALSPQNELFEELVEDAVGVETFPVEVGVIHDSMDCSFDEAVGEVALVGLAGFAAFFAIV